MISPGHDDLSQEWFYLRPSFLDGLITLGSSVGRGSRLERVAKPMIDVTFLSYLGDRSILYSCNENALRGAPKSLATPPAAFTMNVTGMNEVVDVSLP